MMLMHSASQQAVRIMVTNNVPKYFAYIFPSSIQLLRLEVHRHLRFHFRNTPPHATAKALTLKKATI